MILTLKRIFTIGVITWIITIITLASVLDGEKYGAVFFELLISLLSLCIPFLAIGLTLEFFKLGTKVEHRILLSESSEILQTAVHKLTEENSQLKKILDIKD